MELTKQDTQRAKGVAILGMIMLHLFCRLDNFPYTPWIWIGHVPLVYYLGLFGDMCVPIYCFCSGYAHCLQREKQGKTYCRNIPEKLLRFLMNYWIVVVLFSVVGLLSGNGNTIPGSMRTFLGNVFLYSMSYNGAWWFVMTYVFLSLLSPGIIWFVKKLPTVLVLFISGGIYFVAYLLRFEFSVEFSNVILQWIWRQMLLLGTSQIGYIIGVTVRKERWISKARDFLWNDTGKWKKLCIWTIILLPVAAFVTHGIIQTSFVAPFTAMGVLPAVFILRHPAWWERFLQLMGKHSTNIWLTHMFFYLTLFEGLVFRVQYPVFVLMLMLVLCLGTSWIIEHVYEKFLKRQVKVR